MSEGGTTRRRLGPMAFLLLQVALVIAGGLWVGNRFLALERQRALPPLRDQPLDLAPRYDDAEVVSGGQLQEVLGRLALPAAGPPPIATVDHAFRMWGPSASFPAEDYLSGSQMREILTNYWSFALVYGASRDPLIFRGEDGGLRVRTQQGEASSSHFDHTLATLAEVGTPLDFPLVTRQETAPFRELLETSLRDFSLNQHEYEWSALAFALFLPPERAWVSSEGQEISFDRLAARLMRQRLPDGVCLGTHRLHALNAFLLADELTASDKSERLLDPGTRQRIESFLSRATESLVAHQHPEGFWNGDWPVAAPETAEATSRPGDQLADRLIVTGHVLEWWALAPEELLPPRQVIIDAGQWLVRTILAMPDSELAENLSFLTHAGRALALWRGVRPVEAAA